jgi:hypothetical protein
MNALRRRYDPLTMPARGDHAGIMDLDPPRPLSADERAVLDHLLSAEFPGVDALRVQAEHARVCDRCTCGCPTVGLVVDRSAVSARLARPAPHAQTERSGQLLMVEATRRGAWPPEEVLLFVSEDGWLSCLELVPYAEPPRGRFPSAGALEAPVVYPPWGKGFAAKRSGA